MVIALIVVEALALWLWRRRAAVIGLLPGLLLLLALRAALTGSGWEWIALWLTLSLPAHLLDLRQRLAASRPSR